MKRIYVFTTCVMALLFAGCEPDAPTILSKVETGEASKITPWSVELHGVLKRDSLLYESIKYGMMLAETKEELIAREGEMRETYASNGKDFCVNIERLLPETKYYYCAWIFSNETQCYELGSIKNFETEELPESNNPPSKLVAKPFSVSSAKNIYFSSGNLQYHPVNDEWRFAESQLDYNGVANQSLSSAYNGWIDMFGWSTTTTNFGVTTSSDNKDYTGSFVDWGTNKIGNDAPNTWRTLSKDEWEYLLETRTNATSLKGVAQVNGVNGLILLPDDWICPSEIIFRSGFHSNFYVESYAAYQTFSNDQWADLETAGAVFLPAAGSRLDWSMFGMQIEGVYWTTTEIDSKCSYRLKLNPDNVNCRYYDERFYGHSVRLVKDL